MFKKLLSVFFWFSILFISPHIVFAQNSQTYTLAVLDLNANAVALSDAKGLSEKLLSRITWIVKSGQYIRAETDQYEIIERSQIEKILDQFNIQSIGCVSDSCAVEFGKMLQVDRIVIGSFSLIGRTYSINVRIVDIETGITIKTADKDYKGSIDDIVSSIIQDVADELILGIRYADWEKQELITIQGFPSGATVEIKGRIFGTTPVTDKMISLGNNTVRIKKPGYEDFTQSIDVIKGEPVELRYSLIPKRRTKALVKSLIIPGKGQLYNGHKNKGVLIMLLQTAALTGVAVTTVMSESSMDDYEEAKTVYKKAESLSEIQRTKIDMNDKYDRAYDDKVLQMSLIGAAAGIYLFNVIDAAVTFPKTAITFRKKTINLKYNIEKKYSGFCVSYRF